MQGDRHPERERTFPVHTVRSGVLLPLARTPVVGDSEGHTPLPTPCPRGLAIFLSQGN